MLLKHICTVFEIQYCLFFLSDRNCSPWKTLEMSEKKLNLFCQDLAFVLNGWEGGIKNKMLCFELLF